MRSHDVTRQAFYYFIALTSKTKMSFLQSSFISKAAAFKKSL